MPCMCNRSFQNKIILGTRRLFLLSCDVFKAREQMRWRGWPTQERGGHTRDPEPLYLCKWMFHSTYEQKCSHANTWKADEKSWCFFCFQHWELVGRLWALESLPLTLWPWPSFIGSLCLLCQVEMKMSSLLHMGVQRGVATSTGMMPHT